jgi:HPt (histidine-containing phosphotransfer) domain-containing protein
MQHVNWELALQNAGGNEGILRALLEDSAVEAPRLVQQLAAALEGGDLAAGRRAAHTLRAFRRLFGADDVGSGAERMETLIGAGDTAAARELLPALVRDVSAVVAEIEARLHGNE